jgi:hypothetical protein
MNKDVVKYIMKIKEDTGYLRAGFDDLETRVDKVEKEVHENTRWIWRVMGGGTVIVTLSAFLIPYLQSILS